MDSLLQIVLIIAILYVIVLIYQSLNKESFTIHNSVNLQNSTREDFGFSSDIDKPILNSKPHILKPMKRKSKQRKQTLNKVFKATQYNDAYRDLFSAINGICPVQKSLFNQHILPVTTMELDPNDPFVQKLVKHFMKETNRVISLLPESNGIKNDKTMQEHYENLGVNLNLYQETPPNAAMKLIKIKSVTLEKTDSEKRFIINLVLKKDLAFVEDQVDLTVNFIMPFDMFEIEESFNTKTLNKQPIVIENITVNGFYTNNIDFDVDCAQNENIDGDDNLCPYDKLQFNGVVSENDIMKEMNRVNRLHQVETQKFVNSLAYSNNLKF